MDYRSSLFRLHRFRRVKTSEDYYYRSYDADERYWRKCQILWEVSLFKKAL